MDVHLAVGSGLAPWLFILTPLVLAVIMAIVGARWMQRNTRDLGRVGGGLVRLEVTGGWLLRLRRGGPFAVREPMTFVPDPDHERPPEVFPE